MLIQLGCISGPGAADPRASPGEGLRGGARSRSVPKRKTREVLSFVVVAPYAVFWVVLKGHQKDTRTLGVHFFLRHICMAHV